MFDNMQEEILSSHDRLPNGTCLAYGGSRVWLNFNRPWQRGFDLMQGQPGNCPLDFGQGPREVEVAQFPESGWRVRKNEATPYPYHHLVLPITCDNWLEGQWRELGGAVEIASALSIASSLAADSHGQALKFPCHVGIAAGQNQFHPHWHCHGPKYRDDDAVARTLAWIEANNLVLMGPPLRVVIGGWRAGQCWFHDPDGRRFSEIISVITQTLDYLIALYALRFKSVQGLLPDFNVMLRVAGNGDFQYGCYTPILYNSGAVDVAGIAEGTEITLPWPHEVTLEYLR